MSVASLWADVTSVQVEPNIFNDMTGEWQVPWFFCPQQVTVTFVAPINSKASVCAYPFTSGTNEAGFRWGRETFVLSNPIVATGNIQHFTNGTPFNGAGYFLRVE